MKPSRPGGNGLVAAGFLLLFFSNSALAQFVSSEQIVRALTTPLPTSLADKLRLTRSLTLGNPGFVLTSAQSKPAIDLHEIYFEYNSAAITAEAEPQLRALGVALGDSRLRGSIISIGGHTDAVGSDAFNQNLSERRAAAKVGPPSRGLRRWLAAGPGDVSAVMRAGFA